MKRIKFRYKDQFSRGEWKEQECIVESLQECKELYGLNVDCEYELISVECLDDENPICCICGSKCENEWGNNPWPINTNEDARCCDICNETIVIPQRILRSVSK